MVECTVDLCNANGAQWAHIPDHGRCGAGERCDSTAGCVAAGALTGRAFLYGYTDHSGITVSIDGIEGGSTTTAADGSWSLGALPTGTHSVTYSKEKWISQQQTGVAVFAEAASSPPSVELRHGSELGVDSEINYTCSGFFCFAVADQYNGTFYSPDKKRAVVRYFVEGWGTQYKAYHLDGMSSKAVDVFFDPTTYQPIYPFAVTNTHLVWTVANQAVWSRPLDGGPAVILGTALPNESIGFVGTPNTYVVLKKNRNAGAFYEDSLFVVKADGSVPLGTPVWVTPDATHTYAFLYNTDTTALLGLNNTSAFPPTDGAATIPLRRIDLATGAVTNVNTTFATNYPAVYSQSPDGMHVFGYLRQTAPNNWYRSFLIPIDGTAAPRLAPDYGAGTTQYSDYPGGTGGHTWFADSSGVVFASSAYSNTSAVTVEGGLKMWANTAAQSTQLVAYNTYFNWTLHNKVVTYRDSTAATAQLKVVTAHSASPVIYTLDASGTILQDFQVSDTDGTSTYAVWTQSVSSGSGVRAKIFSVPMTQPLVAAPTVTQLGGTLATSCQYEAVLSDTTYWQLCRDTGVLSGFTAATTTAGTQTPNVRGGLIALPDADRVAFRQYDSKLYSSPNTGTLSDVTLISSQWDGNTILRSIGSWILFNDTDGAFLRASNASGGGIDEPLTGCRFEGRGYGRGVIVTDPDKTHVLMSQLNCGSEAYGEFEVPTANLP